MKSNEPPGSGAEVGGLASVRIKNYRLICGELMNQYPNHKCILDVGCSDGLFLDVASKNGLTVTGLEPDSDKAEEARAKGREFDVIGGFFPLAKGLQGRKFDVIIFNDSFEHIPNLLQTIDGIKEYLKENGLLIINIPSSDGVIFRIASMFSKCGINSPLDRLWQKGFASPHLHYFNPNNLRLLFESNGFSLRYSSPLLYYTLDGLWERISCGMGLFKSLCAWLCLISFYPLSRAKSDVFVAFYSMENGNGGTNMNGARNTQ
jgi:SAM-dependent methyltransferase